MAANDDTNKRARDIAGALGLPTDEDIILDGPRGASRTIIDEQAREDLGIDTIDSLLNLPSGVSLPQKAFDGALVGARYRDVNGAWHTLVPLSDSPAEFLQAWAQGVNRHSTEYGKSTVLSDFEIYVVETE